MAKQKKHQKSISNRRARFDYDIQDTLIAGVQLSGAEVRAIRSGQVDIKGSYVTFKDNGIWLTNVTVSGSNAAPILEEDKTRSRKLLIKQKQINELKIAKDKGNTIFPLEILNGGKFIKVRIGFGRGKKLYDKRASLKKKDDMRDADRLIRSK
jgi:SsrA-binding protein